MTSQELIAIDGNLATLTFNRFDLDSYALFLKTKKLPESQIAYDWERDEYRVTTPARFAPMLGVQTAVSHAPRPPLAGHLFDYQRWVVDLALEAKRFSLWLDTGLGKTMCYLEWTRQVVAVTGGRVLILAPLAVIAQVQAESRRFYGDGLPIAHLPSRERLIAWCQEPGAAVGITNYEKFIPGTISELRFCAGLVADESSMLKTGGGVIKWNLIKSARGIEYKLSCTATPAPNDAMEYASQAAFLEKLRTEGDILWTYFSRDKYGNWSVKPHAKDAFYRFMSSWSVYLRDPARFGFADILATLPPPEIIEERIELLDGQRVAMTELLVQTGAGMFADDNLSAVARGKLAQIARGFRYGRDAKGKRTVERIRSRKPDRVAEIARNEVINGRQVLIWTSFDEEAAILARHLKNHQVAVLDGDMADDRRIATLAQFRTGELDILISKPQLIGYGLNLQFVKTMIFSGFDDSFERMYQAIRRCYRFGQTETVRVFIPYVPELEGLVFSNVRQKEARFMEEVAAQELNYRAVFEKGLTAA